MNRYIRINLILFRNSIIRDLKINGYIISSVLFQIFDIVFSILFFDIIFSNVQELGGWNFYQALFLYAFAKLIIVVSTIWTKRGVQSIGKDLIRMGDLDFYLTKPVNPMVLVSISKPQVYEFLNLFFIVPLLLYSALKSGISIGYLNIIWFVLLFAVAQALYYFISVLTVLPAFWFIRLWSLTDILNRLSQFMRYPVNIFPLYLKFLLMVLVPILSVSFIPVNALFYPPKTLYIVFILVLTAIFGLITTKIWKAGLKHYGSASS
jgi:ABC-2 type transport system permease protein